MKANFLKHETGSLFSVITVVIVLAIIGILSQGFFHTRFDLTEDKQFTLGAAATNTLENLPDLITIKAVISSDLPSQFVQIRTHVKDLLEEFRARSGGKLELIFMDPGDDEEKKKQAVGLGIQEVQLQEQSRQGLEIKKGFFGLAITYGDKKEVIPVLNNIQTFEYDLIVKIKKLTGSIKKIAVFEGSQGNTFELKVPQQPPQSGLNQLYPALKTEMEKLYKVDIINLDRDDVNDDVELVIVLAPKRMTEIEKFRLDQFLMKGKSILFLTPGIEVDLSQGINGQMVFNQYESLLTHYGISVKKNVILEARNFQLVPFGNSIFPTPYPYWITVPQGQLHSENAITAKLGQLTLPWSSSLIIDSTLKDDTSRTIEILASSSKESWEETGRFMLFPRDLKEFLPVNQASQPLAVLETGTFTSFYASNPVPQDSSFNIAPADVIKKSQSEGRILVVANALFATNFYMGLMRSGGNVHFLLNAVDQLALDPDLIKIRSRNLSTRPIAPEKLLKKMPIVLINMILVPITLLIIGILVGLRRKRRDAMS